MFLHVLLVGDLEAVLWLKPSSSGFVLDKWWGFSFLSHTHTHTTSTLAPTFVAFTSILVVWDLSLGTLLQVVLCRIKLLYNWILLLLFPLSLPLHLKAITLTKYQKPTSGETSISLVHTSPQETFFFFFFFIAMPLYPWSQQMVLCVHTQ